MARDIELQITVDDKGSLVIKKFSDGVKTLGDAVKKSGDEATIAATKWERAQKAAADFTKGLTGIDLQAKAMASTPTWEDFGQGVASALGGVVSVVTKVGSVAFDILVTGLKVTLAASAIAIGAFVATVTITLEKLSMGIVTSGEEFRRFSLTLEGALKDVGRAKELATFAQEYAATSPATLTEVQQAIKTFALLPQTVDKLKGPLAEVKGEMKDLVNIAVGLATMDPQQGVGGAMWAMREALAGQYRSLALRFNLPERSIEEVSGMNDAQLKDPSKLLQALKMVVDKFVGSDTLKKFGQLPQTLMNNMKDGFNIAFRDVGDFGVYDFIVSKLAGLSNGLLAFFMTQFGPMFGQRLSTALQRSLASLQEVGQSLLDAFGVSRGGELETFSDLFVSSIERVGAKMTQISDWFVTNKGLFGTIIASWKEQFAELWVALKEGLKDFGDTAVTLLGGVGKLGGEALIDIMKMNEGLGRGVGTKSRDKLDAFKSGFGVDSSDELKQRSKDLFAQADRLENIQGAMASGVMPRSASEGGGYRSLTGADMKQFDADRANMPFGTPEELRANGFAAKKAAEIMDKLSNELDNTYGTSEHLTKTLKKNDEAIERFTQILAKAASGGLLGGGPGVGTTKVFGTQIADIVEAQHAEFVAKELPNTRNHVNSLMNLGVSYNEQATTPGGIMAQEGFTQESVSADLDKAVTRLTTLLEQSGDSTDAAYLRKLANDPDTRDRLVLALQEAIGTALHDKPIASGSLAKDVKTEKGINEDLMAFIDMQVTGEVKSRRDRKGAMGAPFSFKTGNASGENATDRLKITPNYDAIGDELVKVLEKTTAALKSFGSDVLFDAIHGKMSDFYTVMTKLTDSVLRAFTDAISDMAVKSLFSLVSAMITGAVTQDALTVSLDILTVTAGTLANAFVAAAIKITAAASAAGGAGGAIGGDAKGGIETGITLLSGTPSNFLPAFADGGVVKSPTLALIGEAGQNEAVVPLPDGKAIPVKFSKPDGHQPDGKGPVDRNEQKPNFTIINTIDPKMIVAQGLNPNLIVNPILQDVRNGGPIMQTIMNRVSLTGRR